MNATSMSLVVIRSKDIEQARLFYEIIGLAFTKHQHGKGLEHFASNVGEIVFEIYPLREADHPTKSARLGFSVDSCDETTRQLHDAGYVVRSKPNELPWGRVAVIEDPDGHKVEIVEKRAESGKQ